MGEKERGTIEKKEKQAGTELGEIRHLLHCSQSGSVKATNQLGCTHWAYLSSIIKICCQIDFPGWGGWLDYLKIRLSQLAGAWAELGNC